MTARRRVAVLISGRGSNMAALVEAARDPAYPAEIVLVASDRPDAAGIEFARAKGIQTAAIDRPGPRDGAAFETALQQVLTGARIELICLAGFMRILSAEFVERWRGRMLNIHPSLLPAFKGLGTHARALAAGARKHGCTVHFVVPELDSGPVILQAEVPVLESDDEQSLAARVLEEEHRIYPEALRLVASGRARLDA